MYAKYLDISRFCCSNVFLFSLLRIPVINWMGNYFVKFFFYANQPIELYSVHDNVFPFGCLVVNWISLPSLTWLGHLLVSPYV